MITVTHLTKRYGDFTAVDDLDLQLSAEQARNAPLTRPRPGQVHVAPRHRLGRARGLDHDGARAHLSAPAAGP